MGTEELIEKLMEKPTLEIDRAILKFLKNHKLDYAHLSQLYVYSLEEEKHELQCEISEGKTISLLFLDKRKSIDNVEKRAIYYLNEKNSPFPAHIFDEQYNYTKEDEERLQNEYQTIYGFVTPYYEKK